MFKNVLSVLILMSFSLFISCGDEVVEQLSAKVLFDKAVKLYQEEEYTKAVTEFNSLSYIAAGTEYEDQAKFYLGMSYFQLKNYIQGADAFEQLIRTNAGSALVPDASYYKALSYYKMSPKSSLDQTNAIEAISDFQTFIDYFPAHGKVRDAIDKISELREKLAKKEFENGITYMKLEYYKSATTYFQYVIDKYYDTPYAEKSLAKKIESLYLRKHWDEMDVEYSKFLEKYPSSELMKDVEKTISDSKAERGLVSEQTTAKLK